LHVIGIARDSCKFDGCDSTAHRDADDVHALDHGTPLYGDDDQAGVRRSAILLINRTLPFNKLMVLIRNLTP
jgi:hypothetical protein